MKHSTAIILSLLSSTAVANETHTKFFQNFVSNMHNQNASLSSLYANNAVIERVVSSTEGIEEIINISGSRYKDIIKTTQGKNLLSGNSDFSSVDFFTNKTRIAIKANRYSRSKCFTDQNYYIVIDKKPGSEYQIIHERIEKPMQSFCTATVKPTSKKKANFTQIALLPNEVQQQNIITVIKQEIAIPESKASFNQAARDFIQNRPYKLSDQTKIIASSIKGKLPITIDKNTQLISYQHNQTGMTYDYRMPKYRSNKKYDTILESIVKPYLSRLFCSDTDSKNILDNGGTITHNYKDQNKKPIFNFTLTKESC